MRSLILVVAVAAPLVTLLPGAFPVSDDGLTSWWMLQVEQDHPEFLAQLRAVILEGAYRGHYRPTQDVLFLAAWDIAGPDGWTRLVLAAYVVLHAGSALLLALILRSLGAGAGAWLAALAFGIHPVASTVFVCAQFAHNVPGLFCTLLGCWIIRGDTHLLARRIFAAICAFLAAGSNPSWLISAPLAIAFIAALHQGSAPRGRRRWLSTVAMVGVGIIAAAALRLHATGTLTTPHPQYSGPRELAPLSAQLGQGLRGVFALTRSGTPAALDRLNPFAVDPGSPSLVLAAIIGVALALLLALPRDPRPPPRRGAWRAWVFAFGLALITFTPYLTLVGYHGQHRYLYPTVAGGAAVAVLLAEWVLRGLLSARWARYLLAATLAPALCVVATQSLESITSIRTAHAYARSMMGELRTRVTEAPELHRVQVLGRVLVVGRSGLVYPHARALQGQLAAMVRRPGFTLSLPGALEDIALGGGSKIGVFRASPSGEVERILTRGELTYRDLCIEFLMRWLTVWRGREDHPIATIPDAELARTFVTVLAERLGAAEVRRLAKPLLDVRTPGHPPVGWGVGLQVPSTLSHIIRVLADKGDTTFILQSIDASDGAAPIVEAALDVAEGAARSDALRIVAAVAQATPECRERALRIAARHLSPAESERFAAGLKVEVPRASETPPSLSGIRVQLVRPTERPASREEVEVVAWLTNAGSTHGPGGASPEAASLRWEWSAEGRDLTLPASARRLPAHGVPPGRQIVLPSVVKGPGLAGRFRLRAILEIGNQTFVGELDIDCR